jgi:hypothetical protein
MPGSPISCWQGVHSKNPMRYSGGLLGGSWLAHFARADIAKGGPDEAKVRALLYVFGAHQTLDERSAFAIRKVAPELAALSLDEKKRIVREQAFALLLDRDHAVRALATMVPGEDDRRKLLAEVNAIVDAAGKPTLETSQRIEAITDLLGQSSVGARVGEVPQSTAKETVRKRSS